ncbi:uncharacterized protein LOC117609872 isoform X1 [Osmia lignaria lignaria]|uniref:uncharacterized protein LOC117609872 isoform X1 n=1 Tax=Osmia lignaria lignaria TaxID=1437193 RepID=UPI0014794548|nr:uncharacterized protein LOC117609872 isoform X1 [Osmia lignaria]
MTESTASHALLCGEEKKSRFEELKKYRKRGAEELAEFNLEGGIEGDKEAPSLSETTQESSVGGYKEDEEEANKRRKDTPGKQNRGKFRSEKKNFYSEKLKSKEYVVTIVLKECSSRMKKSNAVKIYKLLGKFSRFLKGFQTIGYNKAEITCSEMAAANAILKFAEEDGAANNAFLPERKLVRKGVIVEWEDSIQELRDFVMPGQGDFTLEKMKKRVVREGKSEWIEGTAISCGRRSFYACSRPT